MRSKSFLPPLTKRELRCGCGVPHPSFRAGKESLRAFLRSSCLPGFSTQANSRFLERESCGSRRKHSEYEGTAPHVTVTTEGAASPHQVPQAPTLQQSHFIFFFLPDAFSSFTDVFSDFLILLRFYFSHLPSTNCPGSSLHALPCTP